MQNNSYKKVRHNCRSSSHLQEHLEIQTSSVMLRFQLHQRYHVSLARERLQLSGMCTLKFMKANLPRDVGKSILGTVSGENV